MVNVFTVSEKMMVLRETAQTGNVVFRLECGLATANFKPSCFLHLHFV
jgi:hypothetical protein